MVNTELDWLEIRLNELKNEVDYFVILESATTFTGLPKPLHVRENWARFKDFHNKIILRTLDDGGLSSTTTWDHEDLQRNAMFDQILAPSASVGTIPSSVLTPAQKPQENDVIVVSDIDELPKPSALTILRNCAYPPRLTLRSRFYYYSFQFLHVGEEWPHPQATIFKGNDTIRPADLRNGEGSYGGRNRLTSELDKADLWNSSWHCSTCFSTVAETLTKMESFSHTAWNTEDNRNRQTIVQRVRQGLDLFARKGEIYDKIPGRNWDIPQFLVQTTEESEKGWSWLPDSIHSKLPTSLASKLSGPDIKKTKGGEALNGGRFEYLLNRDPLNANFRDYSMVDAVSEEVENQNPSNRRPAAYSDYNVHPGVKGGDAIMPENPVLPGADDAKAKEEKEKAAS